MVSGVKGKLEEWGLRVTQIHGGMKTGMNRDEPGSRLHAEEEFRLSGRRPSIGSD